MKMLRFAAVMMFATAATFACSDDDDTPSSPVAGNAGEGGDAHSGGGTMGGGGKGGAGGAEQGGESALGGAGGQATGGAEQGGAEQGGAEQGGAGGEAPSCVNQFDDSEGGAGGEGGSGGAAAEAFELIGSYDNNYGGTELIGSKLWSDAGIIEYDNADNVAYTQNACDAQFGANLFSKVVYTEPSGGSFYFCTVDFGLATLADAKASTKIADDSDPGTKGCGGDPGFPWTKATAQ